MIRDMIRNLWFKYLDWRYPIQWVSDYNIEDYIDMEDVEL